MKIEILIDFKLPKKNDEERITTAKHIKSCICINHTGLLRRFLHFIKCCVNDGNIHGII